MLLILALDRVVILVLVVVVAVLVARGSARGKGRWMKERKKKMLSMTGCGLWAQGFMCPSPAGRNLFQSFIIIHYCRSITILDHQPSSSF